MDNFERIKERAKFKIATSKVKEELNVKKKKNGFQMIKRLATMCACLICVFGIFLADEIAAKVENMYKWKNQMDIQLHVSDEILNDEEKLEEILTNKNAIVKWDETTAPVVENKNTKVSIFDIDMDNYFLDFKFKIDFPEEVFNVIDKKDIYVVRFPDLVIKDENDNIIFCLEENKLKELFNEDNLEKIKNNNKYCISRIEHYGFKDYNELGGDTYEGYYNLSTSLPSIYPESHKLIFEFSKIALDKPEACYGIDEKFYLHQEQSCTIKGDWKIEVDVPEKCYNRNSDNNYIFYKITKTDLNPKNELLYCMYDKKLGCMIANFNLESIEESGPWGDVKLSDFLNRYQIDPILRTYIYGELCSTEIFQKLDFERESRRRLEKYYLENSNGKKSKENGLYKYENEKMILASKTTGGYCSHINNKGIFIGGEKKFDFEEVDLTDEMKLHIEYLGKDINFYLEKMKGDK